MLFSEAWNSKIMSHAQRYRAYRELSQSLTTQTKKLERKKPRLTDNSQLYHSLLHVSSSRSNNSAESHCSSQVGSEGNMWSVKGRDPCHQNTALDQLSRRWYNKSWSTTTTPRYSVLLFYLFLSASRRRPSYWGAWVGPVRVGVSRNGGSE